MNVPNDEPCVSICCMPSMNYPSGARCYWNVSFSNDFQRRPTKSDWNWVSKIGPTDLLLRNNTGCPHNTVCLSDCIVGHRIANYFFGKSVISWNDSIDGGLICRLHAQDHCFGTYIPDGTKNVISVCKRYFEYIEDLRLSSEWSSRNIVSSNIDMWMMSISLLFFVATYIIYTIIPELKNLHGLMLRTYIACCFVFFLTLILENIVSDFDMDSCNLFLRIPWHFTYLACYFWVNVMAFDLWWTFRSMRKSSEQSTRKKYIIYSIYAWGVPMLIVGIALIRELDYYMGGVVQGIQTRCWIMDPPSSTMYFSGPPAIPLLCNICLYALTTMNIASQKKATAQCLEGNDSRRYNQEKNRYHLYSKLFILTGLTYLGNMLPFLTQYQPSKYVGFLIMVPEYLIGPIIFMLFVCNDRTKQLLTKHLGMKDWVVTRWINSAVVRIRKLIQRPQVS